MIEVVFPEIKDSKKPKKYNNESDLTEGIIERFNKIKRVRCQKIRGTAYGKPTLDILGSKMGMFFWLEVKQPGEKPTKRQYNTMKTWIKDDAIASWTDSLEGAMKFLLSDWSNLTETQMLEGFHD